MLNCFRFSGLCLVNGLINGREEVWNFGIQHLHDTMLIFMARISGYIIRLSRGLSVRFVAVA